MEGYDFDGVVSEGIKPGPNDVIITGRTLEESYFTLQFLKENNIWCPVFFNTSEFEYKSTKSSALHKAKVIQLLGIQKFYEDTIEQALIIREFTPCEVILVNKEGEKACE